jgi:hypothetical protein
MDPIGVSGGNLWVRARCGSKKERFHSQITILMSQVDASLPSTELSSAWFVSECVPIQHFMLVIYERNYRFFNWSVTAVRGQPYLVLNRLFKSRVTRLKKEWIRNSIHKKKNRHLSSIIIVNAYTSKLSLMWTPLQKKSLCNVKVRLIFMQRGSALASKCNVGN